jgi:hypothetical protein
VLEERRSSLSKPQYSSNIRCIIRPDCGLEHDPEKWTSVFGERSCSTKELERDPQRISESDLSQSAGYIPRATSAQCNTVLLFRNSMTPGSIVAGRSCGSTTVATIMSQRSLKTTDIADLPSRLPAVSV